MRKMLTPHKRKLRSKAIPIVQQAVDENPELFIDSWHQITVAV